MGSVVRSRAVGKYVRSTVMLFFSADGPDRNQLKSRSRGHIWVPHSTSGFRWTSDYAPAFCCEGHSCFLFVDMIPVLFRRRQYVFRELWKMSGKSLVQEWSDIVQNLSVAQDRNFRTKDKASIPRASSVNLRIKITIEISAQPREAL